MRKFVFLTTMFVLALTSCVSSPEDKANKLIEEHIKTCLYKPDSYELVSTKVDSAFTPFCDPAFHEMILKLNKISEEIESCESEIDREEREASYAKSTMSIYSHGSYAYARNEYQENKKEYQEHMDNVKKLSSDKDELLAKGKKIYSKIQAEMQKDPKFIGYQAVHRYRANNNADQTLMGDAYFVFDKDFKGIMLVYDVESSEFKAIDQIITELKEEQEEE